MDATRTPRVRLATLLALVLAVVAGAGPAWACSCADLSLRGQVDAADLVARVRVLAIDTTGASDTGNVLYWTRAQHVWKGPGDRDVVVSSPATSASCGLEGITEGQELVLFARKGRFWEAGLCGGTAPAASGLVAEVEQLLGPGRSVGDATVAPTPSSTPAPHPGAPAPGLGPVAAAVLGVLAAGGIALVLWGFTGRRR